jgi:hypothetical protein
MARRVLSLALATGLTLLLAGCGLFKREERAAWRGQAEKACLAQNQVTATAYVQPAQAIDGPGPCGLDHPFKVTALAEATVALNAIQTLGCPMTAALDEWLRDVVQPIALARFGQPVAQIDTMGAYSCRAIDGHRSSRYSEHAFGNAVDVSVFRFADGSSVSIARGWTKGTAQEKAFLREVQAGACNIFTTVLAPGSDANHSDHLHLDLAMHGRTSTGARRICKPLPAPQLLPAPQRRDNLPDAPDIDDEIDVAQAGGAGLPSRTAMRLETALPPAPISRGVAPPVRSAALAPAPLMSAPLMSAPLMPTSLPPAPIPLPPPRPAMRADGLFALDSTATLRPRR